MSYGNAKDAAALANARLKKHRDQPDEGEQHEDPGVPTSPAPASPPTAQA